MISIKSSPKSIRGSSSDCVFNFLYLSWLSFWNCLVDHQSKTSNLSFLASISSMLAIFIHPIGRHYNIESIVNHIHFKVSIHISSCAKRRWSINLNQPGFQLFIEKHIVTINLETMLVIYEDSLNWFKRNVDNIADAFEALFYQLLASCHFQVEFQILNTPLASMGFIIVLCIFLHSHISEMDCHIF